MYRREGCDSEVNFSVSLLTFKKSAHSMRVKVETHIVSGFFRHLGLLHANEFMKLYSHLINSCSTNSQKLSLSV